MRSKIYYNLTELNIAFSSLPLISGTANNNSFFIFSHTLNCCKLAKQELSPNEVIKPENILNEVMNLLSNVYCGDVTGGDNFLLLNILNLKIRPIVLNIIINIISILNVNNIIIFYLMPKVNNTDSDIVSIEVESNAN